MNFVYPTPAEMASILPDLVTRTRENMLGLKLFPPVNRNTFMVRWAQRDNAFGLMQFRGIDGAPPKVQRTGTNTFIYEPGVYGEHIPITEKEMLERSSPNRPDIAIDVSDLVLEADEQLLNRLNTRMEANVWTLLTTGTLTIPFAGPSGTSTYKDVYTTQTFTASVPWATSATATPLADLQAVQQLSVGHSLDFGAGATAYMNQVTANRLLNNANASDFGGRRGQFGATLNNLVAFNSYFGGQNLPQIQIYDDGYQPLPISGAITTASTQFIKFIPDGKVVVVGKRPGNAPIGETQMTLQMMQPGGNPASGEYRFVKDFARGINAPVEVPPKIEVHRGFNGGLALYYANAVVVMSV